MSTAHDIAVKLTERITTIRKANGFNTDIGLNVFRGKRQFDEAELPGVTLIEGTDRVEQNGTRNQVKLQQQYVFEGHDTLPESDPDSPDTNNLLKNPNDHAHLILADLKKAIFQPADRAGEVLGGLVKSITYKGRLIGQREPGIPAVFASVEIAVEYVENLSAP